jgi:hypothetical protein
MKSRHFVTYKRAESSQREAPMDLRANIANPGPLIGPKEHNWFLWRLKMWHQRTNLADQRNPSGATKQSLP